MQEDSFQMNIDGVRDLIESGTNKINTDGIGGEGVSGDYEDILELPMKDEELLELKREWEIIGTTYDAEIKPRQNKNKLYYAGKQRGSENQNDTVVSSNLLFEAEETFIPQALSKNPEPVVWSDNTDDGKEASNDIKTMLQYHADTLCLRRNLGVGVRNWSIYFTAIWKHGWDTETGDISLDNRKPQNFLFHRDGYIDVHGCYRGKFLGEKIECSAGDLIDLFPEHRNYIFIKSNGKLGTSVVRTEWWTDKYCFTTFEDVVLDKHKNEFYNYDISEKTHEDGSVESAIPGMNHFSSPRIPYTFLSVFSLEERPHDITNLIEQNIPNQDRINDRDDQVSKNLASANNAVALSGTSFTIETAGQARDTFYEEGFLLVPDGNMEAVKRIPASPLPNGILESQAQDKDTLRSIFGTQGLTSQPKGEDTTARGMILNQSHDSSRIGGGIGDALEQVADNIFNWWLQLYYVFYDEKHYGAIMGNGRAVEFVGLIKSDMNRHFVVSVSPNSMQPKDEITEQNLAIELANTGWLDPINLFKKLNYPDPMETAKMVTMFKINPQLYFQTFFPEMAQQQQMGMGSPNPSDIGQQGGSPPQPLSQEPASASLSQVPISTNALPK